MKKLITAIIALAMILTAVPALADDPDPIVGAWYIHFEIPGSPVESQFPDISRFVCIFTFEEDGTVTSYEADYNRDGSTALSNGPNVVGRWTRTANGYSVSWMGVGTNPAYLREDDLYVICLSPGVYYRAHKMTLGDWYTDIVTADNINFFLR